MAMFNHGYGRFTVSYQGEEKAKPTKVFQVLANSRQDGRPKVFHVAADDKQQAIDKFNKHINESEEHRKMVFEAFGAKELKIFLQ